MNLAAHALFQPPLRGHEAAVLETAVRLAVDSVLNVLLSVTGARSRESRRVVEDRDREIRRLEARLTQLDRELRLLRRHACSCRGFRARGAEGGHPEDRHPEDRDPEDGDPEDRDPEDRDPEDGDPEDRDPEDRDPEDRDPEDRHPEDPEAAAGHQDCEMRISLGVFGGPPSLDSPLPTPPLPLQLDPPPEPAAIKQEPCHLDQVLIKWEMSQEPAGGAGPPGATPSPGGNPENSASLEPGWRRTLAECFPAEPPESRRARTPRDPPPPPQTPQDRLRSRRRSLPMAQLPEEAQRVKRAAWRAASRRYYARKVARQQAGPSRPRPSALPGFYPPPQAPPPPQEAWTAPASRFYHQGAPAHSLLLDGRGGGGAS